MKKTVLNTNHVELEATFGDFGGYEMPLWYKSAKKEHLKVLTDVGIFDTSHMAMITVSGDDSFPLLQQAFTRDLKPLQFGRSVYGLFLDTNGYVIDDALIYKNNDTNFMVVVNAGMSKIIIDHLSTFDFPKIEILDYCDKLGKIDIQGPLSIKLVQKLWSEELFDTFPYFSYKGSFLDGDIKYKNHPILISRSGYTGEFGFELFLSVDGAVELWDELLSYKDEYGVTPCGLAARDSLRVGAGLPLSHQDIGNWIFGNTPWEFAISKEKASFNGRESIENVTTYTYGYVGYDLRKLHSDTKGLVFNGDKEIGEVLTCVTEVSLTRDQNKILSINNPNLPKDKKVKGLVAGFIKTKNSLNIGDIVTLKDGKRTLKVEIVDNIRDSRTARKSIKNIRGFIRKE